MKILFYLLIILNISYLHSLQYKLLPNQLNIIKTKDEIFNFHSNTTYNFQGILDPNSVDDLQKTQLVFTSDDKQFTITPFLNANEMQLTVHHPKTTAVTKLIDILQENRHIPSDVQWEEQKPNNVSKNQIVTTLNFKCAPTMLGFPYKDMTLFSQQSCKYGSGRLQSKAPKSVKYNEQFTFSNDNTNYIRSFHSTIINTTQYFFLEYINGTLSDEGDTHYQPSDIPTKHYISILVSENNNQPQLIQNINLPLDDAFAADKYKHYYNDQSYYMIPAFANARFRVHCIFQNKLIVFDTVKTLYYAFECNDKNKTTNPTQKTSSSAPSFLSTARKNLCNIYMNYRLYSLLSITILLLCAITYKENCYS